MQIKNDLDSISPKVKIWLIQSSMPIPVHEKQTQFSQKTVLRNCDTKPAWDSFSPSIH
jgi:hypothetical protein